MTVPRPFHARALFAFFERHLVRGLEACRLTDDRLWYARTLRLPHGPARMELVWADEQLTARLELASSADREHALRAVGQLCDLDVDPLAVAAHFSGDSHLSPLVADAPGLRVPGTVDVQELLFRAVIGQQISLAGAASCGAKLVALFGEHYPGATAAEPSEATRLFPTAEALAGADPQLLPMPRARGRAIVALAEALADGTVDVSFDSEPDQTRSRLLACPGVGPWTADYVLMRGLHCPDILLASDLVIRRELDKRRDAVPAAWTPWRSYATMLLWRSWTG